MLLKDEEIYLVSSMATSACSRSTSQSFLALTVPLLDFMEAKYNFFLFQMNKKDVSDVTNSGSAFWSATY
jgi:hypothetical protein